MNVLPTSGAPAPDFSLARDTGAGDLRGRKLVRHLSTRGRTDPVKAQKPVRGQVKINRHAQQVLAAAQAL
jgi:hypothetical protein